MKKKRKEICRTFRLDPVESIENRLSPKAFSTNRVARGMRLPHSLATSCAFRNPDEAGAPPTNTENASEWPGEGWGSLVRESARVVADRSNVPRLLRNTSETERVGLEGRRRLSKGIRQFRIASKAIFFFLDPFDRRSWIIKGKLNIECVVGSIFFFFFFGDRFEGSREWDIIDFEISNLGWIMVRKLHCYEWNILAIFDSWFIWFIDLDFKGNIIMNISNCILTSKVFSYFIIKNYY